MVTSTINDAENNQLSDVIEQISKCGCIHDSTIILKDGRRITGRIITTSTGNHPKTNKTRQSPATVTVHHDIGIFDLDLLSISKVVPG